MGTQAGIGVSHHRNPRMAAQEAVRQALSRGAMDKPDFVLRLEFEAWKLECHFLIR